MSLSEKSVIATYNMNGHAVGLSEFIHEQTQENYGDFGKLPMVYVMDEEGNHVLQAKLEEVTLTDGSKVYNLILKLDK